ncbi:uncharacterized protein LOC108949340 [Ciona intestinalis]
MYCLEAHHSNQQSVTSGPSQWAKRSRPSDEPCESAQLELQSLKYRKDPSTEKRSDESRLNFDCRHTEDACQDESEQLAFIKELQKIDSTSSCLELFLEADESDCSLVLNKTIAAMAPLNLIKDVIKKDPVPYTFCLNEKFNNEILANIEIATRGQWKNPTWFEMRKGMMTASSFHRIQSRVKTLKKKPMASTTALLRHIMKEEKEQSFQVPSLEWGRSKEKSALCAYKNLLKHYHHNLKVVDTGLYIYQKNVFLGCSPDGVVECNCNAELHRKKWLIEIKCPFTYKYKPSKLAARYIGCIYDDGQWMLHSSSKYYPQIQGQMGITRILHCSLVVYTTKGITVVEVPFDKNFFDSMIENLVNFQTLYLFPYFTSCFKIQ